MDAVFSDIKTGRQKLVPVKSKEPTVIELVEDLYIGNLHHERTGGGGNRHCWNMFISSSPTDVVIPTTVQSVTYYLHPTFHPRVVKREEPPFYLHRLGWGYFDVQADIVLKSEYYPNETEDNEVITIRAVHSIHFGSPILTHQIQTNLPYIVDNARIQKHIGEQIAQLNSNQLRLARQSLRRTRQNVNNNAENKMNEDEDDDVVTDLITKQSIPEIIFKGFTLTKKQISEELNKCFGNSMPKEVVTLIAEYCSISSLGDSDQINKDLLMKCRIVLENCYFLEFAIHCPVLELVIRNCGGCDIQYLDVFRCTRLYSSKDINLFAKGECASYRFEKCNNVNVNALDVKKRIIFMSLFTKEVSVKMFDAFYPNSKCVATFEEWMDHHECYFLPFRRSNYCAFGANEKFSSIKGTSLVKFIDDRF